MEFKTKMQEEEPEWRQFELLISRLESALRDKGCKITSPDKIVDQDTGELREVDASIRFAPDDKEVVISVECRRRKDKQDVTWIEQLISKKEGLGLAGTIAVCSSGFSKAAIVKAAKRGILLRRFEEITDKSILSEFRNRNKVTATKLSYRLDTLGFYTQENIPISKNILAEIRKRIKEKEGNAGIFEETKKGSLVQLNHLIHLVVRQKQPNEVGVYKYGCRFGFESNQATLFCSQNGIYLKTILVGIRWTVEEINFTDMNLAHYSEGNDTLIKVARGSQSDRDEGFLNFEMYFNS